MAPDKTDVVLLIERRRLPEIMVRLSDKDIKNRKSLKYLGVTFDKDLRMTEHLRQVVSRATDITARLCQLMPNIGIRDAVIGE